MNHGSLFSGIGGFDLACEWMGWENIFHCEWEEFPSKVLKHYWPNAISYGDIKETDFTIHRGRIDILTGIRGKQNNRQRESEQLNENGSNSNWSDFPTQPPICSGNDGLSRKLDGITFPKWRSESIKAYGNAVVPQVVYQIFKSIEAYETKRPCRR